MSKQRTVDLEAIKAHVLLQLYRSDKPVSTGKIRSDLIGYEIHFNDVYDSLFKLNKVMPVPDGIQLTNEGRYFIDKELKEERQRILHWITENEFELAVLDFLYHRPHLVHESDFPDLLVKRAPQKGNMLGFGNMKQMMMDMDGYVENPMMRWYGITEIGRDYIEAKRGKAGQGTPRPFVATPEPVSERDKQEMIRKLDEILAKLERTSLETEAIWTDMKADFEELRNLFHLGKKAWRQLFIGKLTEWVAGGVISEAFAKPIVDAIKTEASKLLQ